MPFKSDKQRKYLFKNKPKVAKKFAKDSKKKTHKNARWYYYERCQTPMKKSKNADHAPRDQHKKRPRTHKKSLNKAEKRTKKIKK